MKTTLHNMVYRFLTARHPAHILLKLHQDAALLRCSCHFRPTYFVARTFSADARSPAASLLGVTLCLPSDDDRIVSFTTKFSLIFLQGGLRGVQDPVLSGAVGWFPQRPPNGGGGTTRALEHGNGRG